MRYQMLTLAVGNVQGFLVDRRELDRDGPSYMVDTLKAMREEVGEQTLLLFIGADAFAGLESWRHWRQLFEYAHLVVMTRPGVYRRRLPEFLEQRLLAKREQLALAPCGGLYFQEVTLLDISATHIRQLLAAGSNPQFLLPDKVLAFIQQHQLYQAASLPQDIACKVPN